MEIEKISTIKEKKNLKIETVGLKTLSSKNTVKKEAARKIRQNPSPSYQFFF